MLEMVKKLLRMKEESSAQLALKYTRGVSKIKEA
jgi:hypothetical protein